MRATSRLPTQTQLPKTTPTRTKATPTRLNLRPPLRRPATMVQKPRLMTMAMHLRPRLDRLINNLTSCTWTKLCRTSFDGCAFLPTASTCSRRPAAFGHWKVTPISNRYAHNCLSTRPQLLCIESRGASHSCSVVDRALRYPQRRWLSHRNLYQLRTCFAVASGPIPCVYVNHVEFILAFATQYSYGLVCAQAMHYPGPADASIAVRCCPRVVATRKATKHNTPRVSQADYRILFAVATQTEVRHCWCHCHAL